jgi:MHS family proline/betaine transporter-like MFS transporter
MLAMLVTMPFSAWLSDRIGRKKVLATGGILMFFATPLLFTHLVQGESLFNIGLAQFIFASIVGIYSGVIPAVLVELFPTSVRFTGMAIAYNLAAALFGGTAPLVCEWLIKQSGSNMSIAWYVMACNAISLFALYFTKERYRESLR